MMWQHADPPYHHPSVQFLHGHAARVSDAQGSQESHLQPVRLSILDVSSCS